MTNPITPPEILKGIAYARLGPTMRAFELPGIQSMAIRDLFPEIPEPIYLHGDDLSIIRRETEKALENVDLSMIKPGHRVNILSSEHGFNIMGGGAYTEMLKTIRDVVAERTGTQRIRLAFCAAMGVKEPKDIMKYYGLMDYFDGRIIGATPFSEGMPVETEIGTAYVLKDVFEDTDWFIHTHYDDPREIYFNRLISRIFKPFSMSYARLEMRSIFHMSFGSRSANILPRLTFEAPAIRDKHAFSIEMTTSPAGLYGIAADNDIVKLDREGTLNILSSYGKVFRLMATIDEYIPIMDSMRWVWYGHSGGIVAGIVMKSHMDLFDLDIAPRLSEELLNPALKAIVINHTAAGLYAKLPKSVPIFLADFQTAIQQGSDLLPYCKVAKGLSDAVKKACDAGQTDKLMIFDGSYGGFNVSESLREHLIRNAPKARDEAIQLLPKWCSQRGIDPGEINW